MLTLSLSAMAQRYGEDEKIIIWNNDSAPHSNHLEGDESERSPYRVGNISQAELFLFAADPACATGQAVVICPGGGYGIVSMDNEGYMLAEWFAQNGITAAVLKYRLPNHVKEVPLEDAARAIEIMRSKSEEYSFDSTRVGVMGSSAGGHLAAMVSTMVEESQKPNFTILFYPVITGEKDMGHEWSLNSLLGVDRSAELTDLYSLEKRVTQTTPPAILFHCDDDKVVPSINSTRYYAALKSFGTKASIHIYPSGGHGWGDYYTFKYREEWRSALLDWLANID